LVPMQASGSWSLDGKERTNKGAWKRAKIPVHSEVILAKWGGHGRPLVEEASPDSTNRISPQISSINRQMIY
jgi:hypothetical protein